jgi:hypothetical protein
MRAQVVLYSAHPSCVESTSFQDLSFIEPLEVAHASLWPSLFIYTN